jgi:diguanylate cyclase (GGDEF)-like protein
MDELDKAGIGYTLVMADLDHFKQLNDQFGHDVGDQCLEIFSQVLKDACRGSDLPCRLGGEEFVLVLPGVGVKAGLAVALRVRSYLARAAAQGPAPFTVSLGVASSPDHGTSADAVLRAADAALFDAKEAGRDQVVPARMQTNLEAAR